MAKMLFKFHGKKKGKTYDSEEQKIRAKDQAFSYIFLQHEIQLLQ